jgi:hypothetical protein
VHQVQRPRSLLRPPLPPSPPRPSLCPLTPLPTPAARQTQDSARTAGTVLQLRRYQQRLQQKDPLLQQLALEELVGLAGREQLPPR